MVIKRIWDVTLAVSDLGKAVDFYENVLGLTVKFQFGDYAGFDCGGIELGLRTWGDREPPRKGEPCIGFLVDDVDAAVKELRNAGIEIADGPTPTGTHCSSCKSTGVSTTRRAPLNSKATI